MRAGYRRRTGHGVSAPSLQMAHLPAAQLMPLHGSQSREGLGPVRWRSAGTRPDARHAAGKLQAPSTGRGSKKAAGVALPIASVTSRRVRWSAPLATAWDTGHICQHLIPGREDLSLASESARSFPRIPRWESTHWRRVWRFPARQPMGIPSFEP